MREIILYIISQISFSIGVVGILIITFGSFRAFWTYITIHYIANSKDRIISSLGSHLILGLDFLVAKDIIDTMLLDSGEKFWKDLAGLGSIVLIRIVLTHFLNGELRELEQREKKKKKKRI